jgi:small GTP-binding protein
LFSGAIKSSYNEFFHSVRGLDNAGKTTILKRFNGEPIDTISPTLGFNIKTLEHKGESSIVDCSSSSPSIVLHLPRLFFNFPYFSPTGYTLNLWDVGGQKSLRSYWRNYFESTDGLVWVVDSADRMRLDACREELNVLLLEERLAGATLLVLANKQDLPGALSAQEIKLASNPHDFSPPKNRFSNSTRSPRITGRWWALVQSRVINS